MRISKRLMSLKYPAWRPPSSPLPRLHRPNLAVQVPPPLLDRRTRTLKPLFLKEEISKALDAIPINTNTDDAIELATLQLMDKYEFDIEILKDIIAERGLDVSFSNVKFENIAPRAGLRSHGELRDLDYFTIHRARLPNVLFTQIMDDIQNGIYNYGVFDDHRNEEATSRLIETFFARLVAQFKLLLVNTPESIIEGRLTRKGLIEHMFRVFEGTAVIFVEAEYRLLGGREYMNAVAQIIAESDGCDYINDVEGLKLPIYCVLTDGFTWRFFRYTQENNPRLAGARFSFIESPPDIVPVLSLALVSASSPRVFWNSARIIIEVVFYIILLGYRDSLQAYHHRSVSEAVGENKSGSKWLASLELAEKTLQKAESAAVVHAGGELRKGEDLAVEAFDELLKSLGNVPKELTKRYANLRDKVSQDEIEAM